MTRLGLGTTSVGGVFDVVDERDGLATIERAWALGIRYFDTAPLYGYGTAERRLGQVLAGRPRDSFVVSTKAGRLVRGLERSRPARRSMSRRLATAACRMEQRGECEEFFGGTARRI